mmetsp:Transcript_17695/g.48123  ORF Transcript_17695/g.48123 Transcript_17695/m.48123 type:complete len:287 (+) Transcript_17695:1443-2303(+)
MPVEGGLALRQELRDAGHEPHKLPIEDLGVVLRLLDGWNPTAPDRREEGPSPGLQHRVAAEVRQDREHGCRPEACQQAGQQQVPKQREKGLVLQGQGHVHGRLLAHVLPHRQLAALHHDEPSQQALNLPQDARRGRVQNGAHLLLGGQVVLAAGVQHQHALAEGIWHRRHNLADLLQLVVGLVDPLPQLALALAREGGATSAQRVAQRLHADVLSALAHKPPEHAQHAVVSDGKDALRHEQLLQGGKDHVAEALALLELHRQLPEVPVESPMHLEAPRLVCWRLEP